jgi:hypothetical protein
VSDLGAQPDTTTARHALDTAIAQLTQPGEHHLQRDSTALRHQIRDHDTAHLRHIRVLATRYRDALHRGNEDGADRALCGMRIAGEQHRRRRAALTTTTAPTPSLLHQLHDAISSTSGTGNGARGVHRSPLNTSAIEVLADIYRATGTTTPDDAAAALKTWPASAGDGDTARVERWVVEARAIVSPARWTEAKRPCPACGNRHAWIREDGQRIRKAAIQVNLTEGYAACIAPSCTAWWPRDRFDLLAAALAHTDVAAS